MKIKNRSAGTALIVTLLAVLVLSFSAASVLQSLMPRFTVAGRTSAWQEAYVAAEAGIDLALNDLNRNVPYLTTANWNGWSKLENPGTAGSAATGAELEPLPIDSSTESGKTKLSFSKTIVRDNVPMTSENGIPAMVDVQLTALYPTPGNPNAVWIQLRSMGTAQLPGTNSDPGIDSLDVILRKFNLRQMRSTLNGDANAPQAIGTPNAARIIEAIARPVMPFENAISTQALLTIPSSTSFVVDSFDSRDATKSIGGYTDPVTGAYTNGQYDISVRQSNGSIASNGVNPDGSAIDGTQVDANGRFIYGDALTNGGTVINGENVQGEISADYSATFDPTSAPDGYESFVVPPPNTTTFVAGQDYFVSGNQKAIIVTAPTNPVPTPTKPAKIKIYVQGSLNVGSGNTSGISVPPNVELELYVKGNIDFGNADINSKPTDSRSAPNLLIFALGEDGYITSNGNPTIYAGIYAPTYLFSSGQGGGNGNMYGSVVARVVEFGGGGSTAFHYDEALFDKGPITEFKISRYVEDMRR